jgi:hypothetical protein
MGKLYILVEVNFEGVEVWISPTRDTLLGIYAHTSGVVLSEVREAEEEGQLAKYGNYIHDSPTLKLSTVLRSVVSRPGMG